MGVEDNLEYVDSTLETAEVSVGNSELSPEVRIRQIAADLLKIDTKLAGVDVSDLGSPQKKELRMLIFKLIEASVLVNHQVQLIEKEIE